MSRLSLLSAALALAGAALYAHGDSGPDPALSPERVVEIQLEALQRNDEPREDAGIERAWAFAHPANKSVTGPLERFAAMIKSPVYRMLVDHHEHSITRVAVTDETAWFVVTVVPESGLAVFYHWRLEKTTSGAWMTIAVSPPISRGDTI